MRHRDDDTQPRGYTRRELRARDCAFRRNVLNPGPEVFEAARRLADANKVPVRYIEHDLVLLPDHDITIEQVLAWTAEAAATYQRDRHQHHVWRGPDSRVSPPLDRPGYMDIPDDLDATTLTPAEYLAGVHLGWLQRPEAWMCQVRAIPAAHERFLAKVLTADSRA